MSNTTCPECAAEFELDAGTEQNEIIVCPDCGVDLEVIGLEPPTVELAPDGRRGLGRVIRKTVETQDNNVLMLGIPVY